MVLQSFFSASDIINGPRAQLLIVSFKSLEVPMLHAAYRRDWTQGNKLQAIHGCHPSWAYLDHIRSKVCKHCSTEVASHYLAEVQHLHGSRQYWVNQLKSWQLPI